MLNTASWGHWYGLMMALTRLPGRGEREYADWLKVSIFDIPQPFRLSGNPFYEHRRSLSSRPFNVSHVELLQLPVQAFCLADGFSGQIFFLSVWLGFGWPSLPLVFYLPMDSISPASPWQGCDYGPTSSFNTRDTTLTPFICFVRRPAVLQLCLEILYPQFLSS